MKKRELFIFGFFVLSLFFIKNVYASGTIFISPSTLTVNQGETFTVNVNGGTTGVTNVYAIQYDVLYDSSKLSLNSITEGNFLNNNGADKTYFGYKSLSPGLIDDVYTSRNGTTGISALLRSFAILNFTALTTGTAFVNLTQVIWVNSTITNDTAAQETNLVISNGTVTINSVPCTFTSAVWNVTNANENAYVEAIVNGNNCNGQQINMTIWEDDISFTEDSFDDPVRINPGLLTFSSGTARYTWKAEYQQDCLLSACDPPEYYFKGYEVLNPSNIYKSTNLVSVTKDSVSPLLTNIQASPGSTSATITWTTNELSNSSVDSTGTDNGDNINVLSHSIQLTGLSPSTNYIFTVTSCDQSFISNCATSPSLQFTTTTVNLALNKPAVASSVETSTPHVATNAVDGSLLTRWSSQYTDNEWIYVDLQSIYSINHVILKWEAAYGSSYKIQVSNDAITWTDAITVTSGDGGTDDLIFATINGRYIRMLGITRATTYGYSLFEFEVYGFSIQPATVTITNPTDSQQIVGSTVTVNYQESGDLSQVDHVHLILDSNPEVRDLDNDGIYIFTNVPSGPHTVTVYLARADHSLLPNPEATATVSFSTRILAGNVAPTHSTPLLIPTITTNFNTLTCLNQSTVDLNFDSVYNIFNWKINNNPYAILVMPFDEENYTNVTDFSGNNNHGIFKGASWINTGKIGGALNFDGVNYGDQSNTVEIQKILPIRNNITIEFWLYRRSPDTGFDDIVVIGPNEYRVFIVDITNKLQFSGSNLTNGYNNLITSNSTVSYNIWEYWAVTLNVTGNTRIYKNGILDNEVQLTNDKYPLKSPSNYVWIGRTWGGDLNGMLDELRIYNKTLSRGQIQSHYNLNYNKLVRSELRVNDIISCDVTPSDLQDYGTTITSISKTIDQGTYTIPINAGINLISLPLLLDDYSVSTLFQGQDLDIYGYENGTWKVYHSNSSLPSNLINLEIAHGYFVATKGLFNDITIRGTVYYDNDTKPRYKFYKGWNLVGVNHISNNLLPIYVRDRVKTLWQYDVSSNNYTEIPRTNLLNFGQGYWIDINETFENPI